MEGGKEQTLISHLSELRNRLLKIFGCLGVAFVGLYPFSNTLYTWLAAPLTSHLPHNSTMVAIDVASPFLTPFKTTILVALLVTLPILLYQVWQFVLPGLYRREKRVIFPLLISSTLLFYAGLAFAYFIAFPLMFAFFTSVSPEGVSIMTDINRYLDFVIKLFLAFGIAFEVPIATFLLVKLGIFSVQDLTRKRPYVIVGAFFLGMLLTPPDIISQIMLALPMWVLFEIGLLFSRGIDRKTE